MMMKAVMIGSLLVMTVTGALAQEKPGRKHFWHTIETSASPDAIWSLWTDVSTWKEWDSGLQDARMDEDFTLGSKGQIISLQGRKSKFKVVAYEEGKSYTFKTSLPLGGLYVKRTLQVADGMTVFTHEVWFAGLSAGIFARALGTEFQEMLPAVMEQIKVLAEQ